MAEAFSLAANIISVVHITVDVIQRVDQIKKSVDGVPRSLQALSNVLPTLKVSLNKICKALDDDMVPEDGREALTPLIAACQEEMQAVSELLTKMRPKDSSSMARNFKAMTSFRYDDDIAHHKAAIDSYISALTLERVTTGPDGMMAIRKPLKPAVVGPFGRDPDFVDRPVLAELMAKRHPGSRHALVGAAGMGKSQLAIEYGHRIHESSPDTWIFWVDAETPTKIEQGYRAIADAVRITSRNDKDADILKLVYEWLQDTTNGNWVMILDNADDKDVFSSSPPSGKQGQPGKQISDFFPQSSNGNILVTSRSRDAAVQVTGVYKHLFNVEEMAETEAITMLQSQLLGTHTDSDMKLLLETIGYIPLAISQAAAYISKRDLPIPDYLDDLRKADEHTASVLDESAPQLRRDSQRSHSIVTTWKVTFEYVRRTTPSAARLLSLMCMFDRQNIPSALLEAQYGEAVVAIPPKLRKVWWKRRPRMKKRRQQTPPAKSLPSDFEDDWLMLRDFSMIKLNRDRRHFSMHPMVQFTTKKWLVSYNQLDSWSYQFISIMRSNFHDPVTGDFKPCEPLLAHANAAIPYRPKDTATKHLHNWAILISNLASYYNQRAALPTAQNLYSLAAAALATALSPTAPETLTCTTNRAIALFHMGNHTDSETLHRAVLTQRTETLGPTHPLTLESMDLLSDALSFQHRYSSSENLQTSALMQRLQTLGPAHADTQSALNKRGIWLFGQGKYAEAHEFWEKAHHARNTDPRLCDPAWANELHMLGLRVFIGGDARAAEGYLRDAIEEKEKVGVGNMEGEEGGGRDLMQSITKLGCVRAELEDLVEAEVLFRRAFRWYDECAKCEYEERVQVMNDLASVLSQLDKLAEAQLLARRCLVERTEKFGEEHAETLESMWLLGGVLEKMGQWDEALELFGRAYEGAREVLGAGHADTKDYARDLDALRKKIRDNERIVGARGGDDTIAGAQEEETASFNQSTHSIAGAADGRVDCASLLRLCPLASAGEEIDTGYLIRGCEISRMPLKY